MRSFANIPSSWSISKLGDEVDFHNGKAHENFLSEDGNFTLINSKFISTGGQVVKKSLKCLHPLKQNDLVMVMSDVPNGRALARCFLIDKNDEYTLNQRICSLTSKRMEPKYLHFVLDRNRYYLRFDNGVGQTNLRKKEVLDCPVLVPPLFEQRAITNFLTTWGAATEKTERLIAAKEEVKKGLMQRLLFGKFRLGGRKNAGNTEGKWFSTPSDWKRLKIGAVAKEASDKNANGDDLPVLSCTKHRGLVNSLEYFDKQVFSKDTSTYKIVTQGQFAYATNHIEEGSIGYQDLSPKGLISPMYTVFTANSKLINDGYLYKLLKTETFRRIFAINTNASVDRRGSLRWKEFAKLPIPLPDLQEQEKINQLLETAQQEITLLHRQLDLLKKQKCGLMQKLLTGQWRVKAPESQ